MDLTLGAVPLADQRCRFRVWAPHHAQVAVHLVTPTARTVPLLPEKDGYHAATVEGVPPGSRYFYRLSQQDERPDPVSRHQPLGVHGPSAVVALERPSAWTGRPLSSYILYELHVGTFTPAGTFDAVIPRLDALVEFGITAVEIMPVAQFPGGRNWGYDGVGLFAAQNTYGGPHGLRRLVEACHARGLAVVLDVVYNHLGPEGNYLADFAPYFTDRYRTDWGEAINFDGPGSDEVRRFFLENALWWLRDLGIDALRLDAVNMIQDSTARHFLEELAEVVENGTDGPPRYLIAESLLNDPKYVRPRDQHGYGMDAQWCNDFHHALHTLLTPERVGTFADYGAVEHLARTVRQGYHFTGQPSVYRGRRHGRAPVGVRADQLVIYAQNHDITGNRQHGERLGHLVPFAAQKLAAAALLLSPNLPLLFMGEEYDEPAPFQFFTSHGDADLIEAVRQGRAREFAAFGWQGTIPDPQDEATFQRCQLHWELREVGRHRELRDWYRALIHLRTSHPALARLSWDHLEATADEATKTLFVRRWCENATVCIVLHFGTETRRITLPPGRWRVLLDSAAPAGPCWADAMPLAPWQAVVLANEIGAKGENGAAVS